MLIVMHCSGLPWGTAEGIKRYHTAPPPRGRGWSQVGYCDIVENGRARNTSMYRPEADGRLVEMLPMGSPTIHAWGLNDPGEAHPICLIGVDDSFTAAQFDTALHRVAEVMHATGSEIDEVVGHSEIAEYNGLLDPNPKVGRGIRIRAGRKSCPDFDMDVFRTRLLKHIERGNWE